MEEHGQLKLELCGKKQDRHTTMVAWRQWHPLSCLFLDDLSCKLWWSKVRQCWGNHWWDSKGSFNNLIRHVSWHQAKASAKHYNVRKSLVGKHLRGKHWVHWFQFGYPRIARDHHEEEVGMKVIWGTVNLESASFRDCLSPLIAKYPDALTVYCGACLG